jgi:hypothetical protein
MPQYDVISADDHIFEPPHAFDSIPRRLKAYAPKPVSTEQGDGWQVTPREPPMMIGLAARAEKSVDEAWTVRATFDNMAAGAYDPQARIADMELDGVDAQVLYPELMRHGLRKFETAEIRGAVARAYNEWISTFDAFDPNRYVGLAVLPPLDDGPDVTRVLHEARGLGLRGAFLTMADEGRPIHHPDSEQF